MLVIQIQGTINRFSVRTGYWINCSDTQNEVLVHYTAIKTIKSPKLECSVGHGEIVKFDILEGAKGCKGGKCYRTQWEACPGEPTSLPDESTDKASRGYQAKSGNGLPRALQKT